MTKQAATLDSVAQSISDLSHKVDDKISALDEKIDNKISCLSDRMDSGFGQLGGRIDKVEQRLTDVEANQRDTNKRLEKVEKTTTALHNDIVELYSMV